jgi:hypothetical protein
METQFVPNLRESKPNDFVSHAERGLALGDPADGALESAEVLEDEGDAAGGEVGAAEDGAKAGRGADTLASLP